MIITDIGFGLWLLCFSVAASVSQDGDWREESANEIQSFPSVTSFFPAVKEDLSLLTWVHGVNNKQSLYRALQGDAMMIETDVTLGWVISSVQSRSTYHFTSQQVPIMAHPPARTSDLSLEEFLDATSNYHKPKGVKLDFKDVRVLDKAFDVITARQSKLKMPLWLNADVVRGPVRSETRPINATVFLNWVKTHFPGATLSVGCTTRFGPNLDNPFLSVVKDGSYTLDHVTRLRDVLLTAGVQQPTTFPIRAGIAANPDSHEPIRWLLNQVAGSTLTVWGSYYDEVDVANLVTLITAVGKERVYIDVPQGLACQISRHSTLRKLLTRWLPSRASSLSKSSLSSVLTYSSCAASFLPWKGTDFIEV